MVLRCGCTRALLQCWPCFIEHCDPCDIARERFCPIFPHNPHQNQAQNFEKSSISYVAIEYTTLMKFFPLFAL